MIKSIRSFFVQVLNDFDDSKFIRLLKLLTIISMMMIIYAAVFSGFQIVDEFEHLHASWLVSIGKKPYLDFMEHHHPLLWYLSAPIVKFFYDDVIIFYIMRAITVLFSILTLLYIYKIVLFFGDKKSGWLAVALYLGNLITFYNFYQFRPDNFMNFCFIVGIYYWFSALKYKKLRYLTYSFLGFTFSLLFLQKISLLLIVVEFILLGLFALKRMHLKDIVLAAIPSLIVLFGFLIILSANGMLEKYIELNFYFNQALIYYFARGSFWYRNFFISIYGLALVSSIYFYRKENMYFKIIALIYIAEFLMRGFYFAPHPNYYTLLTILCAIILSVYAKMIVPKHKFFCIVICFALFINLGFLFNRLDRSIEEHNAYQHYLLASYVHQNSNAEDTLMNGYDMNYNIYRKDISYYWFGLDMLFPVIEREYHLENKLDINALVIKYRPKFIFARDYPDLMAYRTYGEYKLSQKFIPEIIYSLYKKTPFEDLLELK